MTSIPRIRHSFRKRTPIRAAAVVGFAIAVSAGAAAAAADTNAWAAGLSNMTPEQGRTLLIIARDLFQHEELADSNFTACIDPVDAAAGDPKEKAAIEGAMEMVAGASRRMGYKVFADIPHEDERIRLSKMLAEGRWLRQFKKSLESCLYGQAEVKARLNRD